MPRYIIRTGDPFLVLTYKDTLSNNIRNALVMERFSNAELFLELAKKKFPDEDLVIAKDPRAPTAKQMQQDIEEQEYIRYLKEQDSLNEPKPDLTFDATPAAHYQYSTKAFDPRKTDAEHHYSE